MTREEIIEKYVAGFTICGTHSITDEEWLLDVNKSNSKELIFVGYDADTHPMPYWTEFNPDNYKNVERVKVCKEVTKNFKGKVYMDNVCISDINLEDTP